ncbi:MAG TPA: vanadium-dependent haloperoxidase [Candidatus Polarisedimenticolaceae bacterium]|nr:vanadium-dependent haloperoxidase [Candidatus Polarisedimenticolaceae bacterium]
MRTILNALLPALLLAAPAASAEDEVVHWNRVATSEAAAAQTDPITESRVFAMLHVAMFDAVNAAEPKGTPPRASASAAAAAAAHDVLVQILPNLRAAFDRELDLSLRALPSGTATDDGVALGRAVARDVLAARKSDGADRKASSAAGTKAGAYRPTPPDLTPAFMVQWGDVKPFALRSPAQFRPGPPPAVDSELARRDVEVVRAVGAQEDSTRNDEQSEIARYWYENSTQGWNRIAREVAGARALDLHENARLFALVNMAMADGYIAVFDAKYHYNYWRPVTAIREGGKADWLSYLGTPPIPDYPSGHAVEGAAVATVLARFFGTDFVPFQMESGAPYLGISRRFWSLSEAARENGASRVLAGIHFPTAVEKGYALGESVGNWVFDHGLKPSPPVVVSAR